MGVAQRLQQLDGSPVLKQERLFLQRLHSRKLSRDVSFKSASDGNMQPVRNMPVFSPPAMLQTHCDSFGLVSVHGCMSRICWIIRECLCLIQGVYHENTHVYAMMDEADLSSTSTHTRPGSYCNPPCAGDALWLTACLLCVSAVHATGGVCK